ncbi:MAG: glycosyltransferase [Fluviicola sp.]|nr:glycosyltransferase [Fluviicola sp.]
MAAISIIIPCYNSSDALEKNLPYLRKFISENKKDIEIIVVNDGSSDAEQLKKAASENNAGFVSYSQNRGKGFAIKEGFKKATGELILYTDADIPFETEAIETIERYLTEKEFDLAIGDRSLEKSDYFSKVTKKRKAGSQFFTFIVGRFITTGITDTQCGLKGFRREIAEDLFSVSRLNGFTFDVELIYIALKRNYDIKKIPVSLRSQDGNTVNVLRHGISMAFDLLKLKINHLRGFYTKK